MQTSVSYRKTLPVRISTDVFIAGGGPAGIAAGIASRRQGASVFLAETSGCFGGMGTIGLVPAFMMFGDGKNFLAAGIGKEILDSLTAEKGPDYPCSSMAIPTEMLKRVYDRMMVKAGVDFTFQTQAIDVITSSNAIDYVVINSKSGIYAVKAHCYIDATGDGDLSVWAGAPFEMGDENGKTMPGTLCSQWCDVDVLKFRQARQKANVVGKGLKKAFEDGIFTVNDPHHPGMWEISHHVTGGNFGHAFGVDATDERSITRHFLEGRERMLEFQKFYRNYVPGFERADLIATGSVLGIRESRRIMGDYVLNAEDFLNRAVFEDEIGRYCYPVDIHPSSPDTRNYEKFLKEYTEKMRYQPGESYGIPYRSLIPKNVRNLLVCGRCASTDRQLQGSLRVMPGCYITGQAAGIAAAMTVKNSCDTREISIPILQKNLIALGAYLPNYK